MTAHTVEPIFIAGGTGFVGGHLRDALEGRRLRLLVRDARAHAHLASDSVELFEGDVTDGTSLRGAMDGCPTAINLVAIIAERGGQTFDEVIHRGTASLVREAQRAGVGHFVQMSALGAVEDGRYPYLKAKWNAERVVLESGIPFTIFRPSVIFGPGDEFITTLANLIRRAPVLPVVGSGDTKFQPVAAGDVASAFVRAVNDPSERGATHELAGPNVLSYEEILDVIAERLGKSPRKAHLPVSLMKAAVVVSKPLPSRLRPPVTQAQLDMLALDNCTDRSATESLTGRAPLSLEEGIGYITAKTSKR